MIDLTLLREEPERFQALIRRKNPDFDVRRLSELDGLIRSLRVDIEAMRHEKNKLASLGKEGNTPENRERSKTLSDEMKRKEEQATVLEKEFQQLYLICPNIPDPSIPEGNKEANKVVKAWGEKKAFSYTPKNHVDLNDIVKWFDFEAAAQMTGSGFVFYRTPGAKLLYSLALFMLNNNARHGFTPCVPPFLVNRQALEGSGQLPLFENGVYSIPADGLYTTPTAEVNLTNLYRDHIFMAEELPVRMTAWTSCFRREAGTYGSTERGLIRIHQFEKVELYTIATPEQAQAEHERMLACAESILQQLGLHYRVSLLAAQDCSFASSKTFDIEVWMPGQQAYYEVSSASNCTDFQSRRCGIRYRTQAGGKTQLAYTLNTSSLALPRLMVALMETYQQPDGSIALPDALRSVTLDWGI